MWQLVQKSEQIRPRSRQACCWDVKQSTANSNRLSGVPSRLSSLQCQSHSDQRMLFLCMSFLWAGVVDGAETAALVMNAAFLVVAALKMFTALEMAEVLIMVAALKMSAALMMIEDVCSADDD